jgi:copper(I)-binding protein
MTQRPHPRRSRLIGRFYGEEILAATLFALCLLLVSAQQLLAHEYKVGDLLIDHPWARATPLGSDMGAGYVAIHNSGATPDRLVSAFAPFARRVELQEMTMKDGLMRMMPIKGGLEIPAGGTLVLEPSSHHLVFVDLKEQLKEGEMMDATLTFEKAGKVKIQYKIEAIGATAIDKMHHPLGQ